LWLIRRLEILGAAHVIGIVGGEARRRERVTVLIGHHHCLRRILLASFELLRSVDVLESLLLRRSLDA
jgi:hypothetical protein